MPDKIIKGSYLMTRDGIKKDWGLKISGNRITQVGPNSELTAADGDEVIDASGRLISPGFVNGHMHMYGVLSHGITAEALVTEFSSFLEDYWWPYVENRVDQDLVRLTTEWAMVEMIDSGITSFTDILEAPNSIPGALEIEREVVDKAGMRGFLTFEACQRMGEEIGQLGLKENADFVKNHNKPGERVQGMMSVHTLFTGDKAYMQQAKKMADDLGCDIHMHLSESVYEPNWTAEHLGKKPVVFYDEIGFMDKNVFASQCVKIDQEEIDIMAKHGARAITMPLSNCEVGGGFAPVTEMLNAGMKVSIGTDGYVNNYFECMRGAFLMHKAKMEDPQVMPAKTVYDMGTAMGAEAMGLPDAGRLEEGCLADVITIDLDTPTPINEYNVYDQLVLFRNPQNVNDVIIDGNFVKKDKKLLTLDAEKIKAELREKAARFWTGK